MHNAEFTMLTTTIATDREDGEKTGDYWKISVSRGPGVSCSRDPVHVAGE